MFVKNESYKQLDAFSTQNSLTKRQQILWENSVEHKFFEVVFTSIDESIFKVLYSKKKSRPNVPVNQLVGALILKHIKNWTYQELFTNLSFNLLTRHAIGLQRTDEDVFSEASIFNFQNRVIQYYESKGKDLINTVFEKLTEDQLKQFEIKTNIQRGDSFLVGSNIVEYTRLRLIIEVLQRLQRILSKEDQEKYYSVLEKYMKGSADKYSSKIRKEDLPKELGCLAEIYHQLIIELNDTYTDEVGYKNFKRVYGEFFKLVQGVVEVRPSKELTSSCLMSPDDDEATFRRKQKVLSKGYVAHISETAHPDNSINLITDVVIEKNNVGDAEILENRLPEMVKKTPDLEEYFTDGLYGSPAIDLLTQEYGITQYQTAVRGRRSPSKLQVEQDQDGKVWATCGGGQRIQAKKQKCWKAEFKLKICETCPFQSVCSIQIMGGKIKPGRRVYYFADKEILSHARMRNIENLPPERQTIRANVEASVKEMQRGMKNGKVRVRGLMRVSLHIIFTAIGINLVRIASKNQNISEYLDDMLHCASSIINYLWPYKKHRLSPEVI